MTRFHRLDQRLSASAWLATFLACAAGCESTPAGESKVASLVFDKSAPNIAAMFVGDASGLTGVYRDSSNLSQALRETDWNFDVRVNGPGPGDDQQSQTTQAIKSAFVQYAAEAKEKSLASTVFFYFTGHGSDDGSLITADGSFMFSEMVPQIKQARGGMAIKRLIVLIDSCFSGQNATGAARISASLTGGLPGFGLVPGAIALPAPPDANVTSEAVAKSQRIAAAIARDITQVGTGLTDELIVVTASAPTETSGDESNGGTGTLAFISALRAANDMTTIEAFYQTMRSNAFGQTPQLNTEPPTLRGLSIKGADSRGTLNGTRAPVNGPTTPVVAPPASNVPQPAPDQTQQDDQSGDGWEWPI